MATNPTTTWSEQRLTPAINPEQAMKSVINVPMAPNLTLAKGTLLGKITASGLYAAYNDANANGTQTAVPMLLQYALTTDASSNVTINGEVWGTAAPVYTTGYFRTEDLVGVDAAGVVDIKATIVQGNLTTGLLKF